MKTYRIGQIVPSSNTTMETEIPAMLLARAEQFPNERFTFHSSRMRMMNVTPEELKAMDIASDRCAVELSDARCNVMAYACLVAIMAQGDGYHRVSQERLQNTVKDNGVDIPVLSSAGALVDTLKEFNFKTVSIITPYMKPLTKRVADYIESEGISVQDSISLEVADNLEVGLLNSDNLLEHVQRLNHDGVDAVILSACVQMPSLGAIQRAQDLIGKPVLSASVATVYQMLKTLGLETVVPDSGYVLSGKQGV
ncbi:aspartate/glutamate racemase family protein [Paenalcaligenes niemegkensis]|uniref:maleate cis-trans isomerase family protein n=1 Tax=Paenalcaligenes niemegkensis TaxID=2895469 RepID=UPI002151205B|nr:aspartate/glutamate racemase family protein [Paenalcaligenes niemegkensis]MCQ9617657.1 aspartate/glutamate racemase family protein [Paenalcaligenes niemegkensis]